jgi:DNA-directed RNA polymerase subunit RPC12/RpoP/DNA-binding transcriptional ArsR family regulator
MSITGFSGASAPSPHPAVLALKRAQERVRTLESYLRWEDQLFANPHLSATHKLTLRATRRAAERGQTRDDEGRTRVHLGSIAEQIGVSPDTVSRSLKVLASSGAVSRATRAEVDTKTGEMKTHLYAALEERVLQHPKEIAPPAPRNHGGARYTCQQCGSQEVKIKRQVFLVCKHCQHEILIEETEQDQKAEASVEPQDAASPEAAAPADTTSSDEDPANAVPNSNLRPLIKPVSPPLSRSSSAPAGPEHPEPQDAGRWHAEDIQAAAALLVALAGPSDDHIAMNEDGPHKYRTIHRPLEQRDARSHLLGGWARGASCRYPDGTTRGLCWDADDGAGWHRLEEAAQVLAKVGYFPLLEPSPARNPDGSQRGGHLWIIFDGLVEVERARQHIYHLVPVLADLAEYWPGPGTAKHWNRVRLPGGRYARPGVQEWCRLISVADGEVAHTQRSAIAQLLLAHQPPATVVPDLEGDAFHGEEGVPPEPASPSPPIQTLASGGIDAAWQAKYGEEGTHFWFAFTSAYVATWWNARHELDDLLPSEANGYGLATWRGEREGSVAKRAGRWADFGQSARRQDGSPDTGDALELQVRLSQTPKPEILREAAKALVAEARATLEGAARDGQPLPEWLEAILTDAGRAHYARLCSGRSASRQAQNARADRASAGCSHNEAPEGATHQERVAEHQLAALPADVRAVMEQQHLRLGPTCPCGCLLLRELFGEWVCCRCYPTREYHTIAAVVDRYYPRKHQPNFGEDTRRTQLR